MILKYTLTCAAAFLCASLPFQHADASFETASQHIDLDGTMLGYMDFTGDGHEIGTALNDIYTKVIQSQPGIPPIPVDFNLLFQNLGFASLQSIAMSSKDIEPGLHRNRSVAIFNDAPAGIYALYNDENMRFTAAELAPIDASGAMTASINLVALRDTASAILQQVMGPMGEGMLQQQLSQAVPGTELSYNELIEGLSGKWDAFWQQRYEDDFQQKFKLWLSIEGAGNLLQRTRATSESMGIVFVENGTTLKANLTSLLGDQPEMELYVEASKENDTLILYTDNNWTANTEGMRLADSDTFKALADRLPKQGIAFSYSQGADIAPMMAGILSIPETAAYAEAIEAAFDFFVGDYLKPNMTVSTIKGNAMSTEQYAGYSTKQVITALPAAFAGGLGACPPFKKFATLHTKRL